MLSETQQRPQTMNCLVGKLMQKKGPRIIMNAEVKTLDLPGKLIVSYILTAFLSALSNFIFFTVVI